MRFLLIITLLASLVASPMLIAMSLPCCDHQHDHSMKHIDTSSAEEHTCCNNASSCQSDSCQCQLPSVSYPPVSVIPSLLPAVPTVINTFLAALPLRLVFPDRLNRPPIVLS